MKNLICHISGTQSSCVCSKSHCFVPQLIVFWSWRVQRRACSLIFVIALMSQRGISLSITEQQKSPDTCRSSVGRIAMLLCAAGRLYFTTQRKWLCREQFPCSCKASVASCARPSDFFSIGKCITDRCRHMWTTMMQ